MNYTYVHLYLFHHLLPSESSPFRTIFTSIVCVLCPHPCLIVHSSDENRKFLQMKISPSTVFTMYIHVHCAAHVLGVWEDSGGEAGDS